MCEMYEIHPILLAVQCSFGAEMRTNSELVEQWSTAQVLQHVTQIFLTPSQMREFVLVINVNRNLKTSTLIFYNLRSHEKI